MTRRLAAILVADVAEYSRLMHEDEEATHARFTAAMEHAIEPAVARHGGRIVKSTGDGFLAEFPSAVEAVRCGLEFQAAIRAQAERQPSVRKLLFRVGINVGDVIVEPRDIYGDHVNLAARLEHLAEPGGILISEWVHEYVRGRLACTFEDAGEQRFKNIARPVRTFRVTPSSAAPALEAPADGRPALALSVLGNFAMAYGGREIRIKSLKSRAMLGYLALTDSLQETRERLVGLLWSEFGEDNARATLRQVLHELRGSFAEVGYEGFHIGPREIGFARERVQVDAWDVVQAAEQGRAHPLLLEKAGIADDLLAGFDDLDQAFRVWLLARRQGLRDGLLRGLETALDSAAGDGRQQARLAQAVINLDPTHEKACRALMRARAEAGDTAGALRAYKALWDLLDDEYGMEPALATQELVAAIKTGAFEATGAALEMTAREQARGFAEPQPALRPRSPGRLALSLEPVGMRDIDPAKTHLVQGFRQHLIASLVRFREWSVTDLAFRPRGEAEPGTDERYQLEMLAYQSGDYVNLVLVMKEAESGLYVWSEGFELKLEGWFEAQRRIVRRVAMTLNVHLSAERLRRVSVQPDLSPVLFDRWLRCQAQILSLSPRLWEDAERECTTITEAAPHFSPAYSSIVQMHNLLHIAHPGIMRTREREQKALDFARTAVQLDPVDSRAQLCLGWAYAMAKQYAQADIHITLARELNPNDPWTLFSSALFYGFDAQHATADALTFQATDILLAPSRTHWAYLVSIRFIGGHYQTAIDAADNAGDVSGTVLAWRTAALFHLGRQAEAEADGQRFLAAIRPRWFGPAAPSDQEIVSWLLHLYPISHAEDWARLRDGLRGAGLPADRMAHHAW